KCRLEVLGSAHLENLKRHSQPLSRYLGRIPINGIARVQGIPEHANSRKPWHDLLQELQPLPAKRFTKRLSPLPFPPGTDSLPTRPSPTGSLATMTIGVVWVAFLAASAADVPTATRTFTLRPTSSATSSGIRSKRPSAERSSSTIVCPST